MTKTTAMAMMRSTGVLVGLGIGFSLGCLTVRPNPDHCANLEGDRTCADRYPGERVYCTACGATPEDGCVAERPEDDTCYTPCGGRTPFEDDATCLVDTSSSSGEESTSTGEETGTASGSSESSTTGPMPCVGNEDCPDAAAPFCEPVSGECVACDGTEDPDGACAGVDPGLPLCVGGECVACTPENPVVCDDQLLLCDGGTNACVPCTEHAQCGSGACELAAGRCFPDDFVVTVDGDGPADYMTITAAVAAVDDGTHGVIVVHELDMEASYQATVTINNGKTIALLAAAGERPIILGIGMSNPGLRVESAGTILYMDGLAVSLSPGQGLVVDGAFAWLDRSRIVQNTGGGVLAQNGAELTLRNCFVTGEGNGVSAVVLSDANATILYSTAFSSAFAPTAAVGCLGTTNLSLRNSIVVTEGGVVGDELGCAAGVISYSATEALIPGEGNVAVGPFPDGTPEQWFLNVNAGDLGLQNDGLTLFADVAQWSTDDPPTDIDGDLRPTVNGTADYAGADVP